MQDNNAIWKDNPAFSEAVDDLKSFIDAAEGLSGGQAAGGTTGITSDKEALADNAIDKTLPQIMLGGKTELLVMDDLVGIYRDNAPAFVVTYKAARNIVDAGVRHEDKPAS